MRRVTLRFMGLGYNNNNQAYVKIFDYRGCLIYRGYTYNNRITLCLRNGCYKIEARSCVGTIKQRFMVVSNINTYFFTYRSSLFNRPISPITNMRTFLLTDSNYMDMPIRKGRLYFG